MNSPQVHVSVHAYVLPERLIRWLLQAATYRVTVRFEELEIGEDTGSELTLMLLQATRGKVSSEYLPGTSKMRLDNLEITLKCLIFPKDQDELLGRLILSFVQMHEIGAARCA